MIFSLGGLRSRHSLGFAWALLLLLVAAPLARATGGVTPAAGDAVLADAADTAADAAIYDVPAAGGSALLMSGGASNKGAGAAIDTPLFVAASPTGAVYYIEGLASADVNNVIAVANTGVRTVLTTSALVAPTGMAWNAATSQLLVSAAGALANAGTISSINPSTGAATVVSSSGKGSGAIDLPRFVTASKAGAIYYFETGSATNGVVAVDPATGNRTNLGSGPVNPTGMSYDEKTGTLLISYAGSTTGGLAVYSLASNTFADLSGSGVAISLPLAVTAVPTGPKYYIEQSTNSLVGVSATGVRANLALGSTVYALTGLASVAVSGPSITSAATATAESGTAFTYSIVASGSPTGYGQTGTLPTGLNFNSTTGVISGTPAQTGTFTLGLSATNGNGTGNATLTLTVNSALAISATSISSQTAGSVSQTVTFSGGTKPYTGIAITNFSGGTTGLTSGAVTTNATAGTVTLSGAANTVGTVSFTATVTDTAGFTLAQSYSIAIVPGAASQISVSAPSTATSGTPFNGTVTVLDAHGNTVTGYTGSIHFTSSDGAAVLPANSTLTNGAGTFSFTAKTAGTQTITATDAVTSSLTGTSGSITVSAGAASHLAISVPPTAAAGVASSITVTALDAANNTVTGYAGTVTLTSSDALATLPSASTLSSGTKAFSVTLKTSGSQTVTASDGVLTAAVSTAIAVSPAGVSSISIAANGPVTAGSSVNATVTAHDSFGNVATGYAGTIKITSSDSAAVLPSNSTLTSGAGSFSVTLKTAGSRTITATDAGNGALTATTGAITVDAATVSALVVSAPSTATAGTPISVTVTAKDQFANVVTGYTGTVALTSTDANAGLPANSTLTNGTQTFSVTLKTAGTKTVTATDAGNSSLTSTSGNVVVSPGATTKLVVAAPGTAVGNSAISVTVTAQDAQGNTTPGYAGTVRFTSTDGNAALPSNAGLTNGTGSFNVTLKTSGSQTVTATDTLSGSITGTSGAITVGPGAATRLVVTTVTSAVAGVAFDVTVTAQDAVGNTATGYLGTVAFTKTDAGASSSLPANYAFQASDNGVHLFASGGKLVTVGNQTITATDTVSATITGTSATIAVSPAATSGFLVSIPSTTVSGTPFSAAVTARDAFGNTTPAYTGTVKITLSDTAATAPANSALTNGVGAFAVTLQTAGSRTVTAADTVSSSLTGTATTTVAAGAAAQLAISAPATATAGTAFDVTVTAKDAAGNTATTYRGAVQFTTTDGGTVTLPTNYTFLAGDSGVHIFTGGAILATVGNQTITVTDTVSSALTATTSSIAVSAGGATHFSVVAPSTAISGSAISVAVTALDAFNNTVPTYAGTVHLTSSDGLAVLASNSTLTSGTGSFSVTLKTAGTASVTATDTVASSITGISNVITVAAGAAAQLAISAPSTATAGTAISASVTAKDAAGNVAVGYRGTIHFTTTDAGAGKVVPGDYSFVSGDNGTHSFASGVTLVTSGSRTVTATDTSNSALTATTATITVSPAATASLAVSAPGSATSGSAFSVTVTAKDAYANTVTTYAGTVHLTSTDGLAALPNNGTLTSGVGTFAVTLKTAGNSTVTATDTGTSTITGTSGAVAVAPGAATHLAVAAVSSATAGVAINVTVTAQDAAGNTATGYRGTIQFTKTDANASAVAPGSYTFQAGDNGVHTFSAGVTLVTAGNQTVTATDTGSSTITGTTSTIAVAPAAAASLSVTSSSSVSALSSLTVTVTARDAFSNIATGYAGTVKLTSNDPLAALPANAVLGTGTGVGTFSVTLKTAGSKTVTATDTVTSTIAGTSAAITVNALSASIALSGLEQTYTGSGLSVGATTTPSGLTVVLTYDGSATLPITAGNHAVTATISDPSYAGSTTGTLVIDRAPATVTLGGLTGVYNGNAKFATATTTPAGLAVSYSYLDPTSHAVTAPTQAGNYSVTAVVTDANYSGTATGTLTITQASQTISFATVASAALSTPITLSATATSGLTVQFSVVSGNGTVAGNVLTLTDGNPVVVQATQSGNGNYFAAPPVNQTIAATKLAQTITVGTLPPGNDTTVAKAFTLNSTATSGLPVTYTLTSSNATLVGALVTPTAPGALTIVVSQAGNAVYAAAPSVTISVNIDAIGLRVFFGSFSFTTSSSTGAGLHADAAQSGSGSIAATISADSKSGTIIGTVGGSGFVVSFSIAADGTFLAATTAQTAAGSTVTGPLTFSGKLSGNTLSGTIAELNASFSVTADPASGSSVNVAGFYQAPALNASSGATYSVVGTQGEVFVLAVTPTTVAAGSGTLTANNTFVVTTSQSTTVTGSVNAATTAVTATVTTISGNTTSTTNYSGLSTATAPTDRLGNLSFLGTVTGSNAMVSGFVIGGTAPKNVLLRAIGPSLSSFGISGGLANPELKIYDGNGALLSDTKAWGGTAALAAAFTLTNAFVLAPTSTDAAVLLNLPTGSYTMQVVSAVAGGSGAVLAEIYDADLNTAAPVQRLLNISNLGMVATGSGSVSAGFVVTGNTPKKVLVRGIGPTLAAFKVASPLADPKLTVYSQDGTVIGLNDDWGTALSALNGQVTASVADINAADVATGGFALPSGSKDSALILTLAPGLYTATVTGTGGAGGNALVEIYEISQ